MNPDDIITFVKKNIEPLPAYAPFGERYRVSATLMDNTVLPCVVIESRTQITDLALKRFEETRGSSDPYMGHRAIVTSFVAKRNTVDDYDLKEITISSFAIPLPHLRNINGETSMGWTEFYALMRNGREFRFGTTYLTEFFEMPTDHVASDIIKITPAIRGEKPRYERVYRERPFFTCYVDGL